MKNTLKISPTDRLLGIVRLLNIQIIEVNPLELNYVLCNKYFCGALAVSNNSVKIILNDNLTSDQKNFTIAHELGHYFLNHYKYKKRNPCLYSEYENDFEEQADEFATNLILHLGQNLDI